MTEREYNIISKYLSGSRIISVKEYDFGRLQVHFDYDAGKFIVFEYEKDGEDQKIAIYHDPIDQEYFVFNQENWENLIRRMSGDYSEDFDIQTE